MKLSTTTAMYRDRPEGRAVIPIIDCVRRLHKAGYEDVDFNFCLMNQYDLELTNDHWMDWVKEMKEVLAELNMTAGQAHTPFYNVLDPSSVKDVDHTEEMVRRSIKAAGELGVKAIVIHAGTHFSDNDYKKILRENVEYFKPHVELAAGYGMKVAVENLFDKMDPNRGYRLRRYTARVDEVLEVADTLSVLGFRPCQRDGLGSASGPGDDRGTSHRSPCTGQLRRHRRSSSALPRHHRVGASYEDFKEDRL